MAERILVATDGSEDGDAAVTHALELAAGTGGTIHGLSVVETRTAYDNAIVEPERVREQLRADAAEALASLEDAASRAGVEAQTEIREGVPAEEILETVAAVNADLVVMGARGRSSFRTLLLGSAAQAVLRSSPVPTILVSAGDGDGAN